MSKFKTDKDVIAYPAVTFHGTPKVQFHLGCRVTPLIPHVVVTIGNDAPAMLTLRDAKRLRDWLSDYIKDREGILR